MPARQAAALAATGFVAGAATVAVVHRRRSRVPRRKRKKAKNGLGEIVASNSFLVDVHLLAPGLTVELRVEVVPPWPFRLGGGSADGLMRRRGASLQRLLHLDGEPVHVGVVQPAPDRVLFAARAAHGGGRGATGSRGCASRPASTTTCGRSTTASGPTR